MSGACNILDHTTQEASPFVLNLTYISFVCCLWDLVRQTSWTCSPFPFVLISTTQSSHSKDGKSSFIESFTCAELLSHLFFSLRLCIVLIAVLIIHCQDGGGQNHTITGFCSSACIVFYSPHNHPQYSVSWTTTEPRGNVCMELCVIIWRFFSWIEIECSRTHFHSHKVRIILLFQWMLQYFISHPSPSHPTLYNHIFQISIKLSKHPSYLLVSLSELA